MLIVKINLISDVVFLGWRIASMILDT